MNDQRIRRAIFLMLIVMLIGTVSFKYIESWSWVDAFYFTAITMTTIGYGDIVPTHDLSKVFAVFFGMFSVIVMFYVIGIAVENKFHQKLKEHIRIEQK